MEKIIIMHDGQLIKSVLLSRFCDTCGTQKCFKIFLAILISSFILIKMFSFSK